MKCHLYEQLIESCGDNARYVAFFVIHRAKIRFWELEDGRTGFDVLCVKMARKRSGNLGVSVKTCLPQLTAR